MVEAMFRQIRTPKPQHEAELHEREVFDAYGRAVELWKKSRRTALSKEEVSELRTTVNFLHDALNADQKLARKLEKGGPGLEKYKTVLFDERGRYDGVGINIMLSEPEIQDAKRDIASNIGQIRMDLEKAGKAGPPGAGAASPRSIRNIEIVDSNIRSLKELYATAVERYERLEKLLGTRHDLPEEWRKRRIESLATARKALARRGDREVAMLELAFAAVESRDVRSLSDEISDALKSNDRVAMARLNADIRTIFAGKIRGQREAGAEPRIATELHGLWLAGRLLRTQLKAKAAPTTPAEA